MDARSSRSGASSGSAFSRSSRHWLDNINCWNRMGKLHGTLAKAGKVRKQTPKVAKKDKKR